MELIDTHAHLDEVQDLEGALTRAREAGVQAIVGVGTELTSNRKILQLAGPISQFCPPCPGPSSLETSGARSGSESFLY